MPTYTYPRPALTADVALFREGEQGTEVLLIRRGRPPFRGMWALPGGFVDEMEPPEEAACRELAEETGVRLPEGALRQVAAFGEPGRDPRGWTVSIAFWGEAPADLRPRAADDAAEVRWWPLDNLPPLAFDHDRIIAAAIRARDAAHRLEGEG